MLGELKGRASSLVWLTIYIYFPRDLISSLIRKSWIREEHWLEEV